MKSLKAIQVLSKIGEIISFIVFVASIVGAAGCIIGEISVIAVANSLNVTKFGDVPVSTLYIAMGAGLVLCLGEIFIAKFAQIYFDNELAAKTPFTIDGAKEMMRLGIITVSVSAGTSIVASIVQAIMMAVFNNTSHLNLWSTSTNIGIGIAFILVSVILKCGAESINKKEEENNQDFNAYSDQ